MKDLNILMMVVAIYHVGINFYNLLPLNSCRGIGVLTSNDYTKTLAGFYIKRLNFQQKKLCE